MTWLGYEVIITSDQKLVALLFAVGFSLFGRLFGNALWKCLVGGCVIYVLYIGLIINESAMDQIKAEFCMKHPEIDRCAPHWR